MYERSELFTSNCSDSDSLVEIVDVRKISKTRKMKNMIVGIQPRHRKQRISSQGRVSNAAYSSTLYTATYTLNQVCYFRKCKHNFFLHTGNAQEFVRYYITRDSKWQGKKKKQISSTKYEKIRLLHTDRNRYSCDLN